jgi:hypothetical protein
MLASDFSALLATFVTHTPRMGWVCAMVAEGNAYSRALKNKYKYEFLMNVAVERIPDICYRDYVPEDRLIADS